jgi:hypothetical protein
LTLALSVVDVGHLAVAAGLTYALGFERAVRGAAAGDRVFCMIGTGSGVIGLIATHGAPNALAGAITGVGFIGGGLVFRQATGRHQMVVGLNTAGGAACGAWVRGRRDQNERPGEMRTPSGMSEIGMILKLASPSGMPMMVRHSDMPLSR